MGAVYRPEELAAIGALAKQHKLGLHMDGARFANAVAFARLLACRSRGAGRRRCRFGCTKNGGMDADAIVLFDPAAADLVRWRRKRGGHLQSKGRYLAAQLLALVEGGQRRVVAGERPRGQCRAAAEIARRGERNGCSIRSRRTRSS